MTVYTDPTEPGAPQVGDLVVVVVDGAPGTTFEREQDHAGCLGALRGLEPSSVAHPWGVRGRGWVHSVRWPTPEELAAYQLAQGAP